MRWALLLVILVSVAGGCESYRDRNTIHAFLVEASPRLTPQRATLGAVAAEGNELTLLDGALTLVFRVPHDEDEPGRSFHLHALATPRGHATAGLDLCLVGADLSQAVDELVGSALPPVVSAIRGEPLLGAQHAWSDTAQGITGQSAYLGEYRVRGDASDPLLSDLVRRGVFADMPPLPHDGHMHLVKVVALARDGELRRTVELDGAGKASCERGGDPWGCVMLGAALVNGDAKHRDLERARKVLPRACVLDDADPACQRAGEILHRLDASPAAGRAP
jgi:hypothetical protein